MNRDFMQYATEPHELSPVPEIALWRAVLLMALEDVSRLESKQTINFIRSARHFFFSSHNAAFRTVCHLADIDPDYAWRKWEPYLSGHKRFKGFLWRTRKAPKLRKRDRDRHNRRNLNQLHNHR